MDTTIFRVVIHASLLNAFSYACSCGMRPGYDREDFVSNYDWVSRVKVLYKSYENESQWTSNWAKYRVRHLDIFKANGSALSTELLTPAHAGICQVEWNGQAPEVGKEYLLTGYFKDDKPYMHLCSSLARPWTHVHGDTLRRLAQLEFVESHPDECEETPWKCPSGRLPTY
ncbi:hypothetical protein AAVH_22482 [Aphelenchoides avenae]|nr:hypothetical protein AAVH_22482 [Aphelenchus avenae]